MIIVDERNFIKKAMEEHGLHFFDFFDSHQLMTVKELSVLPLKRRSDVLLIDTQSMLNHPREMELCKAIFNTYHGVVFFYEETNTKAQEWIQDHASFIPKILGECTLPMQALRWTILGNQLQFFHNMMEEQKGLQKHIASFSVELDQVLQTAEWEMAKAKRIHELLIPKRCDEIKGVHFLNKYASGDGGGGEFYDLHHSGNKAFQILVASESYLITSSLMGILNDHKRKDFSPEAFLKDAQIDIDTINSSKRKSANANVLVVELDLTTLSIRAYGKHKAEFNSQLQGQVSLDSPYQLSRGEKFIVFSPGFLFNWKESNQKQDIHSFVKDHPNMSREELVTELFFQIRQEKSSQFLKRDATVVMMEVNRHGMHQV